MEHKFKTLRFRVKDLEHFRAYVVDEINKVANDNDLESVDNTTHQAHELHNSDHHF